MLITPFPLGISTSIWFFKKSLRQATTTIKPFIPNLILNAFYLDDVPRLPLSIFGHLIDVLLPFLHTKSLV
jgi:hypothetical protein